MDSPLDDAKDMKLLASQLLAMHASDRVSTCQQRRNETNPRKVGRRALSISPSLATGSWPLRWTSYSSARLSLPVRGAPSEAPRLPTRATFFCCDNFGTRAGPQTPRSRIGATGARTRNHYRSCRPPDTEFRMQVHDLATNANVSDMLFVLLRRGRASGINRIYRLYREEGLTVRKRRARRRVGGRGRRSSVNPSRTLLGRWIRP